MEGKLPESPWEGLIWEEEIGYGSYGTVYRVTLNGQKYALKRICVPEEKEEPLRREIANTTGKEQRNS